MKNSDKKAALLIATEAARKAGALMRRNHQVTKVVNEAKQYDIKLELDVRCQELIENRLLKAFPQFAILGEEGVRGDIDSEYRWVVDPIDGTVNFAYEIPHACVSIALQQRVREDAEHPDLNYETQVGVVFDPFVDETWTAIRGQKARMNGKPIQASARTQLAEAVITTGFAKSKHSLDILLPVFAKLVRKVRKVRIMGSAALGIAYVAGGRFDGYVESGVYLWDIAAAGLILECAGGDFFHQPVAGEPHCFSYIANNGHLRKALQRLYQ